MNLDIVYDALEVEFPKARIDAMRHGTEMSSSMRPLAAALWAFFVGLFVSYLIVLNMQESGINRTIVFFSIMAVVLIAAAITYLYQAHQSKRATIRRLRFEVFAADNDLNYDPIMYEPSHQGVLFAEGADRRVVDMLRAGDDFEIGNFVRTVRQGKYTTEKTNGYIRITLPRRVAHMLLDAKSNNMNLFGVSLSNLDLAIDRSQKLSLEGNFDDYFTLYAPKEYERDAFYVFTPDLMALLIDYLASCDVEVIDNQLFIYSTKFELLDKATLAKIFMIITTVGGKAISQTDHYADEKVGSRRRDVVAKQGRRLKWGVPWQVVAFLVFYALYAIAQIVADWRG